MPKMPKDRKDVDLDALYQQRKKSHKLPNQVKRKLALRNFVSRFSAKKLSGWVQLTQASVAVACLLLVLNMRASYGQAPVYEIFVDESTEGKEVLVHSVTNDKHAHGEDDSEEDMYTRHEAHISDDLNEKKNAFYQQYQEAQAVSIDIHTKVGRLVKRSDMWEVSFCGSTTYVITDSLVSRLKQDQRIVNKVDNGDFIDVVSDKRGRILSIRRSNNKPGCDVA